MDWVSFGTGAMIVGFTFALFSIKSDEEEFDEELEEEGIPINDSSGRHVILSCQTCRKLKKHKEIEPYLFQCCKCKRHVDIRKAS